MFCPARPEPGPDAGLVELAGAGAAHGTKAAELARVWQAVPVPAGFVLSGAMLHELLPVPARARLAELLTELPDCPEEQLPGLAADIGAVTGQLRLPGEIVDRVRAETDRLELGDTLVVRSSSADEDDARFSFAGVFDSLVGVRPGGLAEAIRQVWLSGFSPRALAQYRRAGLRPSGEHLSVLVQREILAVCAGVAFSEPAGDAYLEWVPGSGAPLMAGLAVATGERLRHDDPVEGWRAQLLAGLAVLGRDGTGHDVEWVYDGDRLWIVLVRPRTAALAGGSTPDGVRAAPLYESDAPGLLLGEVAEQYQRIRAKRRLPRAIALGQGAQVPRGWLVNWDPAGPPAALAEWAAGLPPRLVLDASPTERQHILDRDELPAAVARLASQRPAPTAEFAFLCREFLAGELGLLSTVTTDGTVFVEASADGLLALNRGLGGARPIDVAELAARIGTGQLTALQSTTRACARRLNARASLEWVVVAGRLVFVDHSAPDGPGPAAEQNLPVNLNNRALSAGVARGRVQRLGIDQALTESSIAPIVSVSEPTSVDGEALLLRQLRERLELDAGTGVIVAAARPIAMLSVLIGQVDGFLFEEGALLSHLGILLREAGVPAAIVGTGNLPAEGALVELVHGTITALGHG